MRIRYESSFEKDLKKIRDKKLLKKMKEVIDEVRKADTLMDISLLKEIKAYFRV